MRLMSTAVPLLAIGLLLPPTVRADEHACTPVDASIVTTFVACPADFPSPVGLCTRGNVDSGVLKGTTLFRALSLVPGPSDALLYTGELIITTSKGTVTLRDSGILNAVTGRFFETQVVIAGTRRFKHASGMLTSQGFDIGTGFVGTLTGAICRGGEDEGDRHDEGDRE
jgi:hypothetical protein